MKEKTVVPFTHLKVGAHARVVRFKQMAKDYKLRLLAMGLLPGTEFTLIRAAPLGDPVELRLRGFSLSLRKSELEQVMVELVI